MISLCKWTTLLSALFLAGLVLGAPAPDAELQPRAVNCALVNTVLDYFVKSKASASSFCSAYLQTTVSTKVLAASTTTQLTTTTTTPVVLTTTTSTLTETVTTTTSVYNQIAKRDTAALPTANPGKILQDGVLYHDPVERSSDLHANVHEAFALNVITKRDSKVPYPVWLPKVIIPALVSTACSCYVVPPAPKTVTSTQITATTTTTSTATLTAATNTMTVTSTTTTTATATATSIIGTVPVKKPSGRPRAADSASAVGNAEVVRDNRQRSRLRNKRLDKVLRTTSLRNSTAPPCRVHILDPTAPTDMPDHSDSHVILPNGLIDPESIRRPPGQYHVAKRQQKGNIGGEEFCAPCRSAIYDGDFGRIGTTSWLNDGFENCEDFDKPALYCCLCKHLIRARELARRAGTVDTCPYIVELSWHLSSMEAGIFVHDDGADLDDESDNRLDGFEVEKCYYTRSISRNWAKISLIKRWLSDCELKHGPTCNAHRQNLDTGTSSLLLVDVESDCLVQGRFIDRYFALSYVWGTSKQFLTLVDNYKRLLEPGSLSQQPITQTIRDSMYFVKSLGERYIWIDTVCIIQDDASNKAAAIQQMSSIYSCAVATIICLSGSSADVGLPGIPPTARNASIVPIAPGLSIVERTPLERMLNEHSYGTDEYVYNTRAWTFQERLLSSRSIMFSNEQVYFQCKKELLCEDRYGRDYSDSALFTLEKARVWSSNNKARNKPYSLLEEFRWYEEVISEYTAKRMGYPADIINAFTGVQTQLGKMFDWTFREGLPEPLLDLALLWTPLESTERRTTDFDHPSWSWAGWVGRVHYKDLVRPLHLPIGQAFHALTTLKVDTDNLQTLRFAGETVQLSAFNLSKCQKRLSNSHYGVQVTPHTHFLFDQQNHRCGILHGLQDSHVNSQIQPNAPMILLRLSHWKRVNAIYRNGPVITHLNDSQYEISEDLFDKKFADVEWCTLNVLCVKWWGAGWYRVGVGQVHKEAWRQAKVLSQTVGVQ
ncbi:hypothetical protein OPT61_g3310 [Boeremia exigua]|uniref:Uncharacterized protein n=1 Tax=Boeremia exigua TaxID=749465 RepID=A0ACC2IIC9_9PLEO|nr:hypothetical protein OPT61_g3310 [Boeremia exigua]